MGGKGGNNLQGELQNLPVILVQQHIQQLNQQNAQEEQQLDALNQVALNNPPLQQQPEEEVDYLIPLFDDMYFARANVEAYDQMLNRFLPGVSHHPYHPSVSIYG